MIKTLDALLISGVMLMTLPEGNPSLVAKYKCGPIEPYIIINTYVVNDSIQIVVYSDGAKKPYAIIKDGKTYIDLYPTDGVVDVVINAEPTIDDLCLINPRNSDL